ncbi:MAG: type II toxin-antitoxin system VapC family toxin [Actinobacteria bacterium]|nr:type II toxin-antitoxin system VapC family toxin [Actinomycetota bacterium]
MAERNGALYLDSSALVKLVVAEPESGALVRYLTGGAPRVSCALARTEVVRAVRSHGPAAVARARAVLSGLSLIPVDEALLDDASELDVPLLRSFDAIHLAAARLLGRELEALVTYDERMAVGARQLRMPAAAPST